MTSWSLRELNSLVFDFFWSAKHDLVTHKVVVQSPNLGGFSVVSLQFKVSALLSQWAKRLLVSPKGWTFLLKYWLLDRFDATPLEVFASTVDYPVSQLPAFYSSLFTAWCASRGSSVSLSLVISVGLPSGPIPITSVSCKAAYLLFLSLHVEQPHCILKLASSFGALDWPTTWRSLHFMPLDHQVRDLSWKVAHGVLYTADRLISFGYQYSPLCICGYHLECPEHLFFLLPLGA